MTSKCTDCGRAAVFSCVEDGVQSTLCAQCASRRAGFFGAGSFLQAFIRKRSTKQVCPFCGTNVQDVERTGLVGCPLCYEALQPTITSNFGLQKGSWRSDNG